MPAECINCKGNPSIDDTTILLRINEFGIIGEWICKDCLDYYMEVFEDKYHYLHSIDCLNYCDYSCNSDRGFDLAEQVNKYLKYKL